MTSPPSTLECPKCHRLCNRKHCVSPTCDWKICTPCELLMDRKGRRMAFLGDKNAG